MRVILDTNVFISGIFWSGPPTQILKAWENGKIKLIISPEILDEYKRIGEIISKKYKTIDIEPFLDLLVFHAEMTPSFQLDYQVTNDPNDEMFISCAVVSKAKIIVSGDKHLLDVSGFNHIDILRPREFINKNSHIFK